jgi:glycosidase
MAMQHTDWSKQASIYQINIRQYSEEGTIKAVERDLPRIKALGVTILWLMPIQPIGVKNRKGTLGSNYSVADYLAVNPAFGTKDDFKEFVNAAHALGLYVILDWVANHSAWDNPWVTTNPEYYKKNEHGEIYDYTYWNGKEFEYWTDVVGLNYEAPALWTAMTDALLYWVKECGVDGYRCDVAHLVPITFWEQARAVLEQVKPVFMLAEWCTPEMHRAFDMTYNWDLYEMFVEIAAGHKNAADLAQLVGAPDGFQNHAIRMLFTTNHDKNAWEGHDVELFGDKFDVFAALAFTLKGMPLFYNGQESVLGKRLAFFEKDPIDWATYERTTLFQTLTALKHANTALGNGQYGAPVELLAGDDAIFAFRRSNATNSVTVIANLSGEVQSYHGIELAPWAYEIQVQN